MSFAVVLVGLFLLLSIPPLPRLPALRDRRDRAAVAAGLFFVGAGALHFAMPATYDAMVPLPWPRLWTYLSGLGEIAGGLGMLLPRTRRAAALGLLLLLLAVLPANVDVALRDVPVEALPYPRWYFWLRIPFQAVYLLWVAWSARLGPWTPARRARSPIPGGTTIRARA
jgi:uncharacterized membrane protein